MALGASDGIELGLAIGLSDGMVLSGYIRGHCGGIRCRVERQDGTGYIRVEWSKELH